MKFYKFIIVLFITLLLGGLLYEENNNFNSVQDINIPIGESGYTLSTIKSNKKYSHLIFSSKITQKPLSKDNVYITYEKNGAEFKSLSTGYAYNHVSNTMYNDFEFKNLPKDVNTIKVILNYQYDDSEFENLITEEINLSN